MNWDAIGAIGEMIGSVAVLATLGYLAVQVKHARSEARRALSQGRGDGFRAMMALECDARVNSIEFRLRSALGGPMWAPMAALSEQAGVSSEEMRLIFWKEYGWWLYRVQIMSHADDLSAMERTMFDSAVRSAYGQPGAGRLFYESWFKPSAHPDAVRYVDNLLAQK